MDTYQAGLAAKGLLRNPAGNPSRSIALVDRRTLFDQALHDVPVRKLAAGSWQLAQGWRGSIVPARHYLLSSAW